VQTRQRPAPSTHWPGGVLAILSATKACICGMVLTAVWHDNPYSLKPTDLLNVTIDLTMVGGKLVYQA
jgi:hypothetical protein